MDLTIKLPNELVQRLASRADNLDQSLDEVIVTLLGSVLTQLPDSDETDQWERSNNRRLELIQMSLEAELSVDEKVELQSLQEQLYRRLEDSDDQLLDTLGKMRSDLNALTN